MLSFLGDEIDERIAASGCYSKSDFPIMILAELIARYYASRRMGSAIRR